MSNGRGKPSFLELVRARFGDLEVRRMGNSSDNFEVLLQAASGDYEDEDLQWRPPMHGEQNVSTKRKKFGEGSRWESERGFGSTRKITVISNSVC